MQSVHFDKLKADLGLAKNLKAKNKVRCHTVMRAERLLKCCLSVQTLSRKLKEKNTELETLKADARCCSWL